MSISASAAVIHKWVDENGLTHYSDEAPEIEQETITRIEVPEHDSTTAPTTGNYYSIANQWQRMHRERIERDRLALEMQRQKADQSSSTTEVVYVEKPDETSYLGIYSGFRHLRGGAHRPHKKHARQKNARRYRHANINRKHNFRHASGHIGRPSRAFYRLIQ